MAINASAVRIRFTLPQILIGLVGHAELHYTRDPTMPRDQWPVQKVRLPTKPLMCYSSLSHHLKLARSMTRGMIAGPPDGFADCDEM